MVVIRCLLNFKRLKISDRSSFATGVKDGVYGNPTVFPAPPITEAAFEGLINNFVAKRGAYENGGKAQEAAWNNANMALIDALVETATYVNTLVNGDENIVILAGYQPNKQNISSVTKPTKITNVSLKRDIDETTGMLIADCKAQDGVNTYVCILTEGAPLPSNITINGTGQMILLSDETPGTSGPLPSSLRINIIDYNQNRRKVFIDLTPLKTYYVVFFGINAGGVGSLSDAGSAVCL